MFIKYDSCGDNIVINVPDSVCWKVCFKLLDDNCCDSYNLYLIVEDKTILLRDTDYWCQGRPKLCYTEVGYMYEEIIDMIASKIKNEPNLRIIDIPEIKNKLLEEKYEKKWIEKGYVELCSDGSW